MTLLNTQIGKIYKIVKINEGSVKRRLLDMGFTPGAEIYVSHRSPFGGTVLVGVRGFTVALRDDAAKIISVETIRKEAAADGI